MIGIFLTVIGYEEIGNIDLNIGVGMNRQTGVYIFWR